MNQTVLLGDLIKDIAMGPFGSNLKVDSFTKSGIPIIKGGNLYEHEVGGDFSFVSEEKALSLKRSLAYPDDIVITHRGTLGQVSIVPDLPYPYYLTSQSQLRLTVDKEKILPRYLLYYMRSRLGQNELMQHVSQVGVPSIATPTKAVKSFKIILPSLDTQRRIVGNLTAIDEKIKQNRGMSQTLDQMSQALFKHYFTTSPDVERWPVCKLNDISSYISRGISPKYDEEGQYLVINQRCIRDKRVSLGNARRQSKQFGDEKRLKSGDVLVNSTGVGTLGRVAQVEEIQNDVTFDSHVTVIRPSINKYFFGEMIRSFEPIFESMASGTTGQTELSRIAVSNLEFRLPPPEKIEDFSKKIESLRKQTFQIDKEIASLLNLRDILLPRLISGKLTL